MSAPRLLEGVRVLTLEQVHALPWGTAFLADLGAQVIRIESVEHLQDRKAGPFVDGKPGPEWWNEGANLAYFGTRNKQSLCLQVATPAGKRGVPQARQELRHRDRQLQARHDAPLRLRPRKPRAGQSAHHHAEQHGFGHTGPWSRAGSRARTVDSVCGMSYLTGFEGGPSQRASNNYMDHSTGNNVAYALLLALYRRNRTGKGMRIDLSMQETGVSCIGPAILEAQRGIERPRLGCAHLWKAPHNVYPCAGEDRWIAIAVSNDDEWAALKDVMGAPAWAQDARYDSVQGRWQHRHELDRQMAAWTAPQDDKELARLLQAQGVCAGAVLTAADLVDDPHLKQREFMQTIDRAGGRRTYAGRPFRMPGLSMAIRHVADLGEHNEVVLREVAGLSQEEISALAADGVISNRPRADEKAP